MIFARRVQPKKPALDAGFFSFRISRLARLPD